MLQAGTFTAGWNLMLRSVAYIPQMTAVFAVTPGGCP